LSSKGRKSCIISPLNFRCTLQSRCTIIMYSTRTLLVGPRLCSNGGASYFYFNLWWHLACCSSRSIARVASQLVSLLLQLLAHTSSRNCAGQGTTCMGASLQRAWMICLGPSGGTIWSANTTPSLRP
jgi:hypothetical protein